MHKIFTRDSLPFLSAGGWVWDWVGDIVSIWGVIILFGQMGTVITNVYDLSWYYIGQMYPDGGCWDWILYLFNFFWLGVSWLLVTFWFAMRSY